MGRVAVCLGDEPKTEEACAELNDGPQRRPRPNPGPVAVSPHMANGPLQMGWG